MGLTGSATATMRFEDVRVPADRLLGEEGQGLQIALAGPRRRAARDRGGRHRAGAGSARRRRRLRQAARDVRQGDHRPPGAGLCARRHGAAVESARATTLAAARRKDAGLPYGRQASIAKMVATDNAMKVTTDAVQVLGGYGYTRDFPVERYMREAKVMQIFEGTNQIQRLVISRSLARDERARTDVLGGRN
jgi:alkylation response protein AidB-like acyl-CoA dehydrogenase